MKAIRFFIDVDGTLTERVVRSGAIRGEPFRPEMVEKLRRLVAAGHDVTIWSGGRRNAQAAAKRLKALGVRVIAATGKPIVMVDDDEKRLADRLSRRYINVHDFLKKQYPGEG